jgi:apolipoprotein N-acyltransferase
MTGPGKIRSLHVPSLRASLAGLRWPAALVCGLAAGMVGALSVPPFGFWVLAIVSIAALFLVLELAASLRVRVMAGIAFGLGFYSIGFAWMIPLVAGGWVVLVAFESALTGTACALYSALRRSRTGLANALACACLLVLADALRWSWPLGGMPIGAMDLGQAASPLGQIGRIGGPMLVELATAFLGCCAGLVVFAMAATKDTQSPTRQAFISWKAKSRKGPFQSLKTAEPAHAPSKAPPQSLKTAEPAHAPSKGPRSDVFARFLPGQSWLFAGALLGIVAVVAFDFVAYLSPDGGPPKGFVTVAAVQGGGARGLHAIFTDASVVYQRQLVATDHIPTTFRIGLVLWPEDVIALENPLEGSPEDAQVAAQARRLHATLIAGVTRWVGTSHFLNEAVAWGPDGHIVARYEKVHRVPFGEYVPARSFFSHLGPTGLVPRDAIPGHGPGIMDVPAGRIGVMISFEVFFPSRAASAISHGASLLVVPTNDASYSTGQVPAQEVAADQLRAIETGRDLVQAASTGYTDVVTNRGVVAARTSLSEQAVLIRRVPLRTGSTLYDRVGDGPSLALTLAVVLAMAALRSRRARGGAPGDPGDPRQPGEPGERPAQPVAGGGSR